MERDRSRLNSQSRIRGIVSHRSDIAGEFSWGRSGLHRDCQLGRGEKFKTQKRLPRDTEIQLNKIAQWAIWGMERNRSWQGVT